MNDIKVYGIANCDTVKKARAWFAAQGVEPQWHDFKKAGVPEAELGRWMRAVGWEKLVNRQGTTWRKLSDADKARVVDEPSARALMLEQNSVIKRPVVQWRDGSVTVGFDEADFGRCVAG